MRNLEGIDPALLRFHIKMGGLIEINLIPINGFSSEDT
jgi:hypothetical protein